MNSPRSFLTTIIFRSLNFRLYSQDKRHDLRLGQCFMLKGCVLLLSCLACSNQYNLLHNNTFIHMNLVNDTNFLMFSPNNYASCLFCRCTNPLQNRQTFVFPLSLFLDHKLCILILYNFFMYIKERLKRKKQK